MSLARRPSVGLFCQTRQLCLSRRRLHNSPRQGVLETRSIALRPQDDGFLLDAPPPTSHRVYSKKVLCQLKHYGETIPAHALRDVADREAALSFQALYREKDARLKTLRSLSNPFPEVQQGKDGHSRKTRLPKPETMHISNATFRQHLKAAISAKAVRQVLRAQLLRAEWPRDVLRIVAVAMQDRQIAISLTQLYEPIMRALYRCRIRDVDPEVLSTLHAIITRFRYAGLKVHRESQLLYMALKFAARSRSKDSMRKYLKMIRERGLGMSSNVYRSVIAKFSIGHRGLGEIRNGRWKRSDLREVLLGFEGCEDLPEEEQYHFGSFLKRENWQYLHGWVAVLAKCRESDAVWQEWLLWKETKAYKEPRTLIVTGEENARQPSPTVTMTNKLRGVYWFVEQVAVAGDIEKAWCILKESGVPFCTLNQGLKVRMLDEPEHVTAWDEAMREELLKKYDTDLARIEQALGVTWQAGAADGEGRHELYMDQEEALDRLGSERWKWNEQNGYPWEEETPIISHSERELRDAEES